MASLATIIMWRESEGWGFAKPDTKPFNVFFGREALTGKKAITVGARVSCDLLIDDTTHRRRAANVKVL
jgi:cold shock CspA family protein